MQGAFASQRFSTECVNKKRLLQCFMSSRCVSIFCKETHYDQMICAAIANHSCIITCNPFANMQQKPTEALKNGKADVYLQWSRKNYFFLTVNSNFFLYMLHNCFFAQTFGVNLCQWSQTRGLWATCM